MTAGELAFWGGLPVASGLFLYGLVSGRSGAVVGGVVLGGVWFLGARRAVAADAEASMRDWIAGGNSARASASLAAARAAGRIQ